MRHYVLIIMNPSDKQNKCVHVIFMIMKLVSTHLQNIMYVIRHVIDTNNNEPFTASMWGLNGLMTSKECKKHI